MKNLVIYGDSPFAERIYSYIRIEGRDRVVGFVNDESFITRDVIAGIPVIPFQKLKYALKCDFEIILGYGYTGMNNLREKIYNECKKEGYKVGTYISTNAICYSDMISEGCIILPNVLIGPGTIIGKCNYFAASCVISHDSIIGDFNFFSTNVVLGGHANVGNHCFLGLHSTVKNDITLADYTFLGSACNMLKDSHYGCGYVGNPARKLDKSSLELNI